MSAFSSTVGVVAKTKAHVTRSLVERRAAAIRSLTEKLQDVYEGIFERVLELPHALPKVLLRVRFARCYSESPVSLDGN